MGLEDEGLRKAVRLFLEEGFNVSPEMIKVLSKSEDPIEFSVALLNKIKNSGKKISVLTEEIYEGLTNSVTLQTPSVQVPVPLSKKKKRGLVALLPERIEVLQRPKQI